MIRAKFCSHVPVGRQDKHNIDVFRSINSGHNEAAIDDQATRRDRANRGGTRRFRLNHRKSSCTCCWSSPANAPWKHKSSAAWMIPCSTCERESRRLITKRINISRTRRMKHLVDKRTDMHLMRSVRYPRGNPRRAAGFTPAVCFPPSLLRAVIFVTFHQVVRVEMDNLKKIVRLG